MSRKAVINRKTNETDITVEIDLDAVANMDIASGNGFLDHDALPFFPDMVCFDLKLKL